jgi:hypothetical protein
MKRKDFSLSKFGSDENLEQNQYATLLVILSCISDHWNIFPKEK